MPAPPRLAIGFCRKSRARRCCAASSFVPCVPASPPAFARASVPAGLDEQPVEKRKAARLASTDSPGDVKRTGGGRAFGLERRTFSVERPTSNGRKKGVEGQTCRGKPGFALERRTSNVERPTSNGRKKEGSGRSNVPGEAGLRPRTSNVQRTLNVERRTEEANGEQHTPPLPYSGLMKTPSADNQLCCASNRADE